MKKMDKKGFTLIELLAVIVILAIIMVIAVPQILNVIENSRESAWKSNVKMIEDGLELGKTLTTGGMSSDSFDITAVCVDSKSSVTVSDLQKVADISAVDNDVACTGKGILKVTGKGQFDGRGYATIDCSGTSCTTTYTAK